MQDLSPEDEMVILNDNPECEYVFEHPNIKILNVSQRFLSISSKLMFGMLQCKNRWIYRLDDDDLLLNEALNIVKTGILQNPGFDIYRSSSAAFYVDGIFKKYTDNINNGNIYDIEYVKKIKLSERSGDEDVEITYGHGAKIYTNLEPTMGYRWGMNTLHISGLGKQSNEYILNHADLVLKEEKGIIEL